MIKNRLFFGTGFRADLVSVVQAVSMPLQITQIARLIGSVESTASRIVSDLKACGFLDRHNLPTAERKEARGLFISADSVANASALSEAKRFKSDELRRTAIDDMDARFDGLMRSVIGNLTEQA